MDTQLSIIGLSLIACWLFIGVVSVGCLLHNRKSVWILSGVWVFGAGLTVFVLVADQIERHERTTRHARFLATANADRAFSQLNKPRIDLDTLAKHLDEYANAEPINDPPLQVTKNLPDWIGRPQSDYVTQSDFLKKLYAEQEADWIRIRRPRSKRGLDRCLAMERWVVLRDVRSYCTKRSDGRLGENAELGMTDKEIYRRFVKHRYLVEENGEHTIYTMTIIKNGEGGDELLNKTLERNQASLAQQPNEPAPTGSTPDWVTTPPKRVGEVFRQVLKSGPYATVEECYRDADARLNAVAHRYANGVELHLGEGSSVDTPDGLHTVAGDWGGPAISELRRRLARDTHLETVDASFGEMKQLYTLVEITPDDGKWLTAKWKAHKQQHRLMTVGFIAGGVLVLVAGVLALLKIDEATRGYYTKRLFIGVPAAVLVVAMAALLLIA